MSVQYELISNSKSADFVIWSSISMQFLSGSGLKGGMAIRLSL